MKPLVLISLLCVLGGGAIAMQRWLTKDSRAADAGLKDTKRLVANTDEFIRLSRAIQAAPTGSPEQERLIDEMEIIQPGFRKSIAEAGERRDTATAGDGGWEYSSYATNAGSKTVKVGCILSDQQVSLKWPYSDTSAHLCIRTSGDVYLRLTGEGQILMGDEYHAVIRIGDDAPRRFKLVEPTDHSSNQAFIEPEAPLLAAAKAGKKIAIEATYYEAGSQTATFTPKKPVDLSKAE